MANLSDLPVAGPLTGSELLPAQQGSGAVRIAVGDLFSRAGGAPIAGNAGFIVTKASGEAIRQQTTETNASTISMGINASTGLAYVQSTSTGTGATLPLAFYVGATKACQMQATHTNFGEGTGNVVDTGVSVGLRYIMSVHAGASTSQAAAYFGANGSGGRLINFYRSGAEVGSISTNGSSTSYNTSSDYRLKDEEGEISDEEALAFVERSRPIWFRWKTTGERVDGYLAHEVQEYAPNAVTGEKDATEEIGDATGYRERDPETGVPILGTLETLIGIAQAEAPEGYEWTKTGERPVHQGIDQSKLVPRLNAGLKAAVRLIRSLETTVSALEQRLAALETAA